jgi:S-adenosylmethionine synthetase
MVDFKGSGVIDEVKAEEIVREVFDLRPAAIISYLDLKRPIYRATAAYGHFGRTDGAGFSWEATSRTDEIRKKAGI